MNPKRFPFTIWQINAFEGIDAFTGECDFGLGEKEKICLYQYYSYEDNEDAFLYSREKWENETDDDVLYYSLKYDVK